MVLTKAVLVDELIDKIGLNKRESKELVDSFFYELNDTLAKGENVKLPGFGNFILRDKKERLGRNPKTGEKKIISARRVVTFKVGQKLRLRVGDFH
ncbi:MAG: integration host factor subunit alpha [Pseudomonadota bacterium]